jgi:hypothetical protein
VRWHARAWRWLAGDDGPTRRGLPVAELLAPAPLAAVALLAVNDWYLKRSAAPGWLTGKLSDFAGIFAFPLIVTAVADSVLLACARSGLWRGVDFTLRRWKLACAIAATAVGFSVMKLSPVGSAWLAAAWAKLAGANRVAVDPSDLLALATLPLTWWHGRRAIARGAYGRLELAQRRASVGRVLQQPYADAAACGADPEVVSALEEAVDRWLAGGGDSAAGDEVAAALARLRGLPPTPHRAA